MKVKPVIYSMKPKYPDKYSIDTKHEILNNTPHRWMNKPLTLSALSATILFSSCSNTLGTAGPSKGPSNNSFINIPVFSHGEGIGIIGCVSVVAPMFLTEEEAYTIISEELKNAGIDAFKNDKTSSGVKIPLTGSSYESDKEDKIKTKIGSLTYDASLNIDSKNINIEFVSAEDYKNWQDPNQGILCSVEGLNIKGAAETLAKENSSVAAFYDPFITYEPVFKDDKEDIEIYNKAHDESSELLKAQVKDFIEWLKAEGVI